MKLAPGEGRKPLYLTTDKLTEELAYPCVFDGHFRDLPEDLSILKKLKSDILRLVILNSCILNLLLLKESVLNIGYGLCQFSLRFRSLRDG